MTSVEQRTKMVQQIFDQMLTAVVVLDKHLHIQYMNAAAENLLDGSRKRLQDAPFFSLFRYISLEPMVLQHALDEQQSVSDSEVVLEFHDGQRSTVEFSAQPLMADSFGYAGVLLELRQIDQIRRINQEASQQQQLLAAQSMIRGLAHEIKNPLGGLRGAAQLLAGELPNPELREYTDLIMTQADRLRVLVDRMLGSHELPQRAPQNVHAVIERALQVAKLSDAGADSVQWLRDYDPSLPELTMAADGLEQALLNILINAYEALTAQPKAQPNGQSPQITVRTRITHQQTLYGKRYRSCAVISIIDNGPGIAQEIRDTLFYPMVSGRAGGTGLGLSIAQNIVHQHAGKIEIESHPGHTEFTLFLPYVELLI